VSLLITAIVNAVLNWLKAQFLKLAASWAKDKANHDDSVKTAKDQIEPIKKVENKDDATAEEISTAIDDASKRF
jgi:hypothetical protein